MAKMKKPSIKQALKKVDNLPEAFLGKIDVDLSTLPCLKKSSKEKITANFDSDVLDAVRRLAKKHHISYATLINDVLRKVFVENKKAS
ncbi:MAG: BrnA antitoxin family protein [Bacteriovorax sp.]|nr:BrnA antitoxin family protein [Bacteriovorax sp.]